VDRFGRIDVLFNNAAASTGGYVAALDIDGWERSLRVMLTAALYGMQAAIPHMLAQGGGSIVSTRRSTVWCRVRASRLMRTPRRG
jgi:NAD(P)-dependent dehydrogenase (short-subunit alcohol dehydrogenase family)